jgi:hypothetical protein
MPAAATVSRRFSVHSLDEAPSHAHLVDGADAQDAALHFLEAHHPAAGLDDEVALIVEDCETGDRQCFRIDLTTGETAPCD